MFTLVTNGNGISFPQREMTANVNIAVGDVLTQVAGANDRVDPVAANASAVTFTFGVAAHAALVNTKVMVLLPVPGTTWIADCNANSAVACVGSVFTMAAAGQIGGGAPANQGGRVVLLRCYGASTKAKYEVAFVQSACRY